MELTGNAQIDLESENELSADFLVMGLCDRLYKLSKDPNLSLKDSFGKYLGNSIGSFNHHSILYNKKYFSDSNIGIMNGFYFLFKQICETVNTYNESKVEVTNAYTVLPNVILCMNKLYNVVSRCVRIFDYWINLKTIYNEFIDAVIKDNKNDQTLSSKLVKLPPIDKSKFGSEFNTKGCQKLHKKLAKTTPNFITLVNKMLEDDEKRKNGEGSQRTSTPSQPIQSQSDSDPSTADSPPPPQNGSSSQTPQTGGSSSGNGNPGGGSSDPASSTPGGSFNLGSSLFKILLNGAEKLNKTSQFIQKNQQKVKEVTDKISGVYNDTVENLKDAYDKSSSYLSEFINNVTSQLNQVDSPSNSGGNQLGSGSPSGEGNLHNQLHTSITKYNRSNRSINLTNDPQPNPAHSPTTQKQHLPNTVYHTASPQTNTSTQKTTAQINDQLLKSPNSDPFRDPLEYNSNYMEWISGLNFIIVKKYIFLYIFILVFIIWIGKKFKEKKSMNRVIKLADGNRKTQIIIKSYDRNKHLKPVINSVDRKKDLLLNIYKLMQADPVPFINLFFLLIFFVYKRKLNYLEL
ncbi:PIR protein CIR protein [Plasmodium vinckei petteri]|uniref:PIR protein CIR protein n=1 Tax=Plasmodium vinckei petteri TaxID=138298 RepID=A0A6V7S948_PLAVN|nr:PIR protein CIR protein [Plasmodium vinckei petteri]